MSDRKMRHLFLLQMLLFLELVKDTSCFVSSLILLKKGHKPKMVHGHHFVAPLAA